MFLFRRLRKQRSFRVHPRIYIENVDVLGFRLGGLFCEDIAVTLCAVVVRSRRKVSQNFNSLRLRLNTLRMAGAGRQ